MPNLALKKVYVVKSMKTGFLSFILFCWALAAQGVTLDLADDGQYKLAPYMDMLKDPSGELTLEDVVSRYNTDQWQPLGQDDANFGFDESAYWFRVVVSNHNAVIHEWVLEIAYPQLDHVDVFFINGYGEVQSYFYGGDQLIIDKRIYNHPHLVFPALLFPYESITIIMRVQTEGALQVPATLWHQDKFNFHSLSHFLAQGLFYGMVLIMALYNFMVWLSERQGIYLTYVSYILFFTLFQSSISGIGFQYLWPDWPSLNQFLTPFCLSSLLASLSVFILEFFECKQLYPRIANVLRILLYAALVSAIVGLVLPYHNAIQLAALCTIVMISTVIGITIYMVRNKHPSANYFALAWSVFLGGAVLLTANKLGLIPITPVSEYGLQFGASLEIMFLSLALADRMARNQTEKIEAQQEALTLANEVNDAKEQAFIAELENLRIEKETNDRLEQLVKARTLELQSALDELSIANERLQTISVTDALTGLHNRYYFDEHYKIEFKRAYRDQSEIALIMLDIDHFKRVNDQYGHPAGDECLRQVAQCIKRQVGRESDICCRLGGEEFAIILPATPLIGALEVAENIRRALGNVVVSWEAEQFSVTASLGVSSVIPQSIQENSFQFLINQADQALYQAKHQGRNQVVIFERNII